MTDKTDFPSAAVRIRAMKRDRFQCTYCGAPGTDVELEIDHIIPVSKGGSHHISNLTTACRKCNQTKSDKDAPPRVTPKSGSSLVGMWLHTLDNGVINWQGRIIGLDGEIALVQLFSWMDGSASKVEPIPKSVLYSEGCTLYADGEAMKAAYDEYSYREQIKNGH